VWAGSDGIWDSAWGAARRQGLVQQAPSYPGAHRDDWEAYVVRLHPDGRVWVRASSHGHWQACKEYRCRNRWTQRTGWTRVSRGSHAGHIPIRHELRRAPRWVHPRQLVVPGPGAVTHRVPQLPGHDLHERTTTGEGLRPDPLETLDRRSYRPLDEEVHPALAQGRLPGPGERRVLTADRHAGDGTSISRTGTTTMRHANARYHCGDRPGAARPGAVDEPAAESGERRRGAERGHRAHGDPGVGDGREKQGCAVCVTALGRTRGHRRRRER
jgi:hypothetical protein